MSNIWEAAFAVVDVETTGSDPKENRITEIACVKVIGGEIADEYSSLINPHQFIPPFIARMTGISNAMASTAPEPRGVLDEIFNILSVPKIIFTAHNVGFDWNFVRHSLYRQQMNAPIVEKLCTLKLARKLVGKGYKKNVGDLAKYFGIEMNNRHRALGDARATALILLELLEIVSHEHGIETAEELLLFQDKRIQNYKISKQSLPRIEDKLTSLPTGPGVYYFLDKNGDIIYVGKAKCLKDKVGTFFNESSVTSRKIAELVNSIHDIKWETTNSELSAWILESREIKRINPKYNSADKMDMKYRIRSNGDNNPSEPITENRSDSHSPETNNNSINNNMNNMLLIMPEDQRANTIIVYLIKYGKLADCVTIGRKADLSAVNKLVSGLFYNGSPEEKSFSPDDITDMSIVSSWVNRNKDSATFLYPDGEQETSFISNLENQIRRFHY